MYSNVMSTTGSSDANGGNVESGVRLGTLIRQRRFELGLTQKQVEARSGGALSQNYISQVERGAVGLPSFDMLNAFADALSMDVNDLKIAAGYPVVTIVEGSASLRATATMRASGSVRRPHSYYKQLATQALEELPPEDWDEIEAMLERRRRSRQPEDA